MSVHPGVPEHSTVAPPNARRWRASAVLGIATTRAGTTGFTNAFTVSAGTAAAPALVARLLVPTGKPPAEAAGHAH